MQPLLATNQTAIRVAPCTVSAAKRYVKEWHRHLPALQGGLFAVSVIDDLGKCLGVGVFGNPPRVWQGTGRGVITRCATEGAENACSMVYGALCRAAKALGYREAWTYTLPEEPGTSLRAAGFMDMGLTAGGEWDTPSRPRKAAVRPRTETTLASSPCCRSCPRTSAALLMSTSPTPLESALDGATFHSLSLVAVGDQWQANLLTERGGGWRVCHGRTAAEAIAALFAPVPGTLAAQALLPPPPPY